MKTIYKYPLTAADEQLIEMPLGAIPLSVQMQNDKAYLWALVDPDAENGKLNILIQGTGHNIDERKIHKHISTFQMMGGSLVFHAFEGFWTKG